MFDVFKKNKKNTVESEANVQTSKVKYKSAKQTLKLASKKWKNVSNRKIFWQIRVAAKIGLRHVTIHDAYITDGQKTLLEDLGYKVEARVPETCHPYIDIYW